MSCTRRLETRAFAAGLGALWECWSSNPGLLWKQRKLKFVPTLDIFLLMEISQLSHMLIKLDCNTLLHLSRVKTFSYSANLETVNLNWDLVSTKNLAGTEIRTRDLPIECCISSSTNFTSVLCLTLACYDLIASAGLLPNLIPDP